MDDVHHWHVDVVVSAGRRDAEEPDRVVVAAEQVVHTAGAVHINSEHLKAAVARMPGPAGRDA